VWAAPRLFLLGLWLGAQVTSAQGEAGPSADEVESAFDDAFADFGDSDDKFDDDSNGLVFSGFVEGAYGRKLDRDPRFATRQSLGDVRARTETEWSSDTLLVTIKGEALYDEYLHDFDIEARELSLQLSPAESLDLKIGRQVLTWGTGDLLFLNDLFPKSWVSFFSGRDDEYLKAPSDSVRVTWYTDFVNLDVVWSPRFEPDDYLTGRRFSFFSRLAGDIVAPEPPLSATEPEGELEAGELALRLFRTVGSTEYAAYAYRGFFKRPLGIDATLEPTFPALSVIGGSLRRPFASGILNIELALHDSRADGDGSNPLVPNDQIRLLAGYEFEARSRLTVAFQYYLERTLDYGNLMANSLAPQFEPDRNRHVLTNRVTYRGERQKLTLTLFTFYSPSDDDYYLRPGFSFRQSDRWAFSVGANLFNGSANHTFFGQLEDNSNAWLRVRFSY
jgi:hypothetical protein